MWKLLLIKGVKLPHKKSKILDKFCLPPCLPSLGKFCLPPFLPGRILPYWAGFFWYRCYYPYWSRDSLSPVCGIFLPFKPIVPAYGRQSISWPMRMVALIAKNPASNAKFSERKKTFGQWFYTPYKKKVFWRGSIVASENQTSWFWLYNLLILVVLPPDPCKIRPKKLFLRQLYTLY